MKIVGCDLHTRYQQIAMLDAETGELIERRLETWGLETWGQTGRTSIVSR